MNISFSFVSLMFESFGLVTGLQSEPENLQPAKVIESLVLINNPITTLSPPA